MSKGKFLVMEKQCDQCLFSRNRIVSAARKKEILRQCVKQDSHFICHKTNGVCCRGFYDRISTNLIRIAAEHGVIEFVPAPSPIKEISLMEKSQLEEE